MSDKPSGLLARWNLRRQQVQAEEEAEAVAPSTAEENETLSQEPTLDSTEQAIEGGEKLLTAEDLPDPEKIEVGGSFASFMADNVDPNAKTAALRALWKQPHYNEIDGLLEYALDYSNQPKLSADVSAELAKKVFRHVIKDKDEQEEVTAEEMTAEIESVEDHHNVDASADILDATTRELSQNEPEVQDIPKSPVA